MKPPLVSVCVVTYQHVKYIEQCLDSILSQKTSFRYEIILGEDESSDGTREICQRYAKQHKDKIRLFLRSRNDVISINGRPTGRYNFIESLKQCQGKYIALCEGDDYWTDDTKLQKQVDFLEENEDFVISCHGAKTLNDNGDFLNKVPIEKNKRNFSRTELMTGSHVVTLSICFRNMIKTFPKEYTKVVNADTFLTALLGQYGKSKYHTDIKDGVYRLHGGGIWSVVEEETKVKARIKTFRHLYIYMSKNELEKSALNTLIFKIKTNDRVLYSQYFKDKKVVKLLSKIGNDCLFYLKIGRIKEIEYLFKFIISKI